MTREEVTETFGAHEWQWKEDLKTVMCPTCGAQYRAEKKRRLHRAGCKWVALVKWCESALGFSK